MAGPATNIVVLGQQGRDLIAVVNGAAAMPFDLSALPAGGGVIVADAPTWWIRNNLDESTAPWATRDELDAFLVAAHRAGYQARSLSSGRVRKLCKLKARERPTPEALAPHVHDQVATGDGTALWCGTCDTHTAHSDGRPVLVSAHVADPGMDSFTPTAPYHLDPRPIVAFDWSAKGVHATADGYAVERFADIASLVATLDAPTKLACETTFESWDPQRRTLALELIRSAGHELYVFRPIHTPRRRPDGMTKTDANDARVIYSIAIDGHFHLNAAPAEPDLDQIRARKRANREYNVCRHAERKPELAGNAENILGDYKKLDDELAAVLGNGDGYSTTLLAAVWLATTRTESRTEFEQLLGLHGAGYPALLRSDVHHHVWRHADGRGVTLTAFRRAIRRTRRLLLDGGARHVDNGPVLPNAAEVTAALLDVGFPLSVEQATGMVASLYAT